jgi:hypothetical protein
VIITLINPNLAFERAPGLAAEVEVDDGVANVGREVIVVRV